ncbi:MAG TPA: ElyC/SanA/YdcF family protein [Treponemataceae bacterium]|nr:ElyC/SanA/YdcF family protein [Treponemataceae bacterium]
MKTVKKVRLVFYSIALLILVLSFGINVYMCSYAKKYIITSFEELPQPKGEQGWTCLVLGAQVTGTTLSPVLHDRVEAGIQAFSNKTVQTLLLSGDHGKQWYDEVNAMRVHVLKNYPELDRERIFLDHAGFDTYDSVRRAEKVFCAQNLVICTQEFHSFRAIYIARKLGIHSYAYAIDQSKYSREWQVSWACREFFARVKSFFETIVRRAPKYVGKEISVNESGLETWDLGK